MNLYGRFALGVQDSVIKSTIVVWSEGFYGNGWCLWLSLKATPRSETLVTDMGMLSEILFVVKCSSVTIMGE